MIIAFAFGLIGALLVLANCRTLRNNKVFIGALIFSVILTVAGIYFMNNLPKKTDAGFLFPVFTPFTALVLLFLTRIIYKRKTGRDIIIHLHGLFPVKQTERYITGLEKTITFILLILSVVIPYLVLTVIV